MAPKSKSKQAAQVRKPAITRNEPVVERKIKRVKKHPLVQPTARRTSKHGALGTRSDLTRVTKWPKYVQLQRQRRVLLQRLRVPPAINQFHNTLDRNTAARLLSFLEKYKPESALAKKQRLMEAAEKRCKGEEMPTKAPSMLKFGLNHITDLIEIGKAQLVVMAHDVDPIELMVCLPALCRHKNIPYCIVKGKSRLGKLVHQKSSPVVAMDSIRKEDQQEFATLCAIFRDQFNDNANVKKQWGGGILSPKTQLKVQKAENIAKVESLKRIGLAAAV